MNRNKKNTNKTNKWALYVCDGRERSIEKKKHSNSLIFESKKKSRNTLKHINYYRY